MTKLRRLYRSRAATMLLFVLAALLLLGSTIGGARAALTYYSDNFNSELKLTDGMIGRINTPGGSTNLLAGLPESVQPGRRYDTALTVTNASSIDAFVRVTVYKYWEKNGAKQYDLDPALIQLSFGDGWQEDLTARTDERTVLYCRQMVPAGTTTGAFLQAVTVSDGVLQRVTQTESGPKDHITVTSVYDYNGASVCLVADADLVQTHSAEAAILSAWGRAVTVSGNSLSLR